MKINSYKYWSFHLQQEGAHAPPPPPPHTHTAHPLWQASHASRLPPTNFLLATALVISASLVPRPSWEPGYFNINVEVDTLQCSVIRNRILVVIVCKV